MGIKRLLFAARGPALTAVFVLAAYAAGEERRRDFTRELTPLTPSGIEEAGSSALAAHEFKHGHQFIKGEIVRVFGFV